MGGIGKSTALKHLAWTWAQNSTIQLQKFDFAFFVPLKSMKKEQRLSNMITEHHKALKRRKVDPAEIQEILDGDLNVLLLLDGYDEYEEGTSADVDAALTKDAFPDCCIVLTSRDHGELSKVKQYMDVIADITGFDEDRIVDYVTKYLGDQGRCQQLMNAARHCGIVTESALAISEKKKTSSKYGILQIPFLLQMICVLFLDSLSEDESNKPFKGRESTRFKSRPITDTETVERFQKKTPTEHNRLPRTKTETFAAIVERCAHWEELRSTGQKTAKDLEAVLLKLGELVMTRLSRRPQTQTFSKVCWQFHTLCPQKKFRAPFPHPHAHIHTP